MLHTIEVTQDDIAMGRRRRCRDCPVAMALARHFERGVMVGHRFFVFGVADQDLEEKERISLPSEIERFIDAFDCAKPVDPIIFTVEIPDAKL